MSGKYSATWYRSFLTNSASSAAEIVPLLLHLMPLRSVVDVGCGLGVWLRQFQRQGVEDVLGIDGFHVPREELLIPEEQFVPHDLSTPPSVARTFDLAVCLEVAEHLPESAATPLVECLTSLAPVVFFSAAIPAQGGTHHINEQWLEYWTERFQRLGYEIVDAIRPRIWNNDRIDFWYAQNAVLFVRRSQLAQYPRLATDQHSHPALSMVHPTLFLRTHNQLEQTLDYRLRRIAHSLKSSVQGWLPSRRGWHWLRQCP